MANAIQKTIENPKLKKNEKFVFINAWNEWAKGTHLEPDQKYGFAYLNATYEAIRHADKRLTPFYGNQKWVKKNHFALIYHLHYIDCLDLLAQKIKNFPLKIDIYISLSYDTATVENIALILKLIPQANIRIFENRGRDVLPFILLFHQIKNLGYEWICKIHSKKTLYRKDGAQLYQELLDYLLNDEIIKKIKNKKSGILIPKKYAFTLNAIINNYDSLKSNQKNVNLLCDHLHIKFNEQTYFPAGTMFWFQPAALEGIDTVTQDFFDIEEGYVDGTIPHGIERILGLLVEKNNFEIGLI